MYINSTWFKLLRVTVGPTFFVGVAFKGRWAAVLLLVRLKPPIKSHALHLSGRLEVLAGPNPAKITRHDLYKAAIWHHEVVVDQASTMHASLKMYFKNSQSIDKLDCSDFMYHMGIYATSLQVNKTKSNADCNDSWCHAAELATRPSYYGEMLIVASTWCVPIHAASRTKSGSNRLDGLWLCPNLTHTHICTLHALAVLHMHQHTVASEMRHAVLQEWGP